ncbi:ComEC/Rec2 family competence protein [Glutamicibacter endophyticus]
MSTDLRGLWLLTGAWVCALLRPDPIVAAPLAAVIFVLTVLLLRQRHATGYAAPWFTAPLLLALAALAMVGLSVVQPHCELPGPAEQTRRARVEFRETMAPKSDGRVQGRAQLLAYRQSDQHSPAWQSCTLDIYLTLPKAPPEHAQTLEVLLSLERNETGGSIDWWGRGLSEPSVLSHRAVSIADRVKARLPAMLEGAPEQGRALLPGMLYGDRSGQDEDLSAAMKLTGLSHLTAVSGSNCALLTALALRCLRALGLGRWSSGIGALTVLGLFVVFVGPDPSVLRAGVMGAIGAVALLSGRERGSLGVLSFTGCILLAVNPSLAAEPGFALSMLATLGIILFGTGLSDALGRWIPNLLAQATAICLAAQLTCLPIIIALSGSLSPYTVPLNLMAAPLVPGITVLGLFALLLAGALDPLAQVLAHVAVWPAELIGRAALHAVHWPGAARPWPEGAAGLWLAVVVSLGLSVILLGRLHAERPVAQRTLRFALPMTLVVIVAAMFPLSLLLPPRLPSDWDIALCDVGQGDGMVLNAASGAGWLIDTGPPESEILGCLRSLGIRELPRVFLSHEHADHIGALPQLRTSDLPIGKIFIPEGFDPSIVPEATVLRQGEHGGTPELSYAVLGPTPGESSSNPNDHSLVLRFEFDTAGESVASLVTAGDMEQESMAALLRRRPIAPATVLKASHHGARNGGADIIEAVQPQLFLISVGAQNSYGHPHAQILDRARAVGAKILRTDHSGTVLVTFDAEQIRVNTIHWPVR